MSNIIVLFMMVPETQNLPIPKPLHLPCVPQFEVKTSAAIVSVGLSWVFLYHLVSFLWKTLVKNRPEMLCRVLVCLFQSHLNQIYLCGDYSAKWPHRKTKRELEACQEVPRTIELLGEDTKITLMCRRKCPCCDPRTLIPQMAPA